ncbi:hypothetical protein [Rickettsiales endosymbiont of Trichoplax sp. H2]|uniref:hypothetical protein n=1 Tax=Rickettsiales endosymbiont of Trichoplax sp. H2 TaxID=2021221 RepID=UPI0012B1BFD3|nr:hypothetical protein [Rickettsiales endosymbiont of Trichoplax sp. H2]MSO14392.1 hypothetical protein [Rickettsiales endosymbiont of Trichoplax sp. H2]
MKMSSGNIKNNNKINQKDLFNPELFLTIDKINKRFGKDAIGYGSDKSDYKLTKVLESTNVNILKKNANDLLKKYQKIDREIILYSKAKKSNANVYKIKLLKKEKERIRKIYIEIRQKVLSISS